jgi:phospholipid/cholesterol/gamma-HCH transport system substrate-binding protein
MKKYSMESVAGIFVVIGLLCVGYMTVKLGNVSLFADDYYPLYAHFSSVSGLRADSPVEIYGIEVGRIERLAIDKENQTALVELRVRRDIDVYDDARATIKTSGLIGDRFVNIDPGGGGDILKPGGTITETGSPLDIEALVSKYVFGDIKKDNKEQAE